MALSVIASAKNNAYDVLSTGVTVTHGFSLLDGDVLYVIYAEGDNNGSAAASTDWAQLIFTSASSGDDRALAALRKVITNAAGEPASYTFTINSSATDHQAVIILQIRGADTTTPEDAATTSNIDVDDFTPANVTIDTVTANTLVIIAHMASLGDGVAAGKTGGAPAGWSLTNSEIATAGADIEVFLEVATLGIAGTGTVTPGSWTGSPNLGTEEYATIAIAVRPAAAGGGSIPGNPFRKPFIRPFGGIL